MLQEQLRHEWGQDVVVDLPQRAVRHGIRDERNRLAASLRDRDVELVSNAIHGIQCILPRRQKQGYTVACESKLHSSK